MSTTSTSSMSSPDVNTQAAVAMPATSSTPATTSAPMSERMAERRGETAGETRMERHEVMMGIRSLEQARHRLQHASHDFGGRRPDALRAVDDAIKELRLASAHEARDEHMGMESPANQKAEEHELNVALRDTERARRDMEQAKHNFNGRRKEALAAVDRAIAEVRRAAEYDK